MAVERKKTCIRRITTPVTTVTFAVMAFSGSLMLFHVQDDILRGPHEVFGVLFIIVSVTHLVLNWRPFVGYIRKTAFWICTGVGVALVGITYVGALHHAKGEVGPGDVIRVMETASLEQLAPLVGTTAEELVRRLEKSGMQVGGPTVTLETVGQASNRSPGEVIAIVLRSPE
jgi:hypothetical protein